jgi:galactokinase
MLKDAKKILDFTDYKRVSHIVSENDLVLKGIQALRNGDIELFGSYLYISHESSRKDFENSCPELDYLVELSKAIPGCVGARLSGGGFGGTSIHIVKKEEADRYRARITTAFKLQTNTEPQTIVCGGGNGAGIF